MYPNDEDDEDLVDGQSIDGQADAADLPSSLPAAWQIPMVNAPPYQVPPGSTPPPVQSDSDIVKRAIANISSDGKGYGKEELLQAQRLANQGRFNAGIGETASNLAYAIAGVKNPNPNAFASIKEQANAPLDDFKAGRALSQEDKKTDLDTQKLVMANMMAKAKQAQAGANQNALQNYREGMLNLGKQRVTASGDKASEKEDASFNKQLGQFGDALDPNKGRAGEFGKQQAQVNSAKRVEALGDQFPDGNLPKSQMGELALATANLVSAGNHAAEATVSRLVPSSAAGNAAALQSWLESEPTGANQQAFAKLMFETAKRERAVAEKNLLETKLSRVSQYEHLAGDPGSKQEQRFQSVMKSKGISPEVYDQYKQNNFQTLAPKAVVPDPGLASAAGNQSSAPPPKKFYSQKLNKTKLVYPDGREEVVDGRQ